MLTETVLRRLEQLGDLSRQGKRVNGLFRLMECPLLWHEAYARIYAKDGAITQGWTKPPWTAFLMSGSAH